MSPIIQNNGIVKPGALTPLDAVSVINGQGTPSDVTIPSAMETIMNLLAQLNDQLPALESPDPKISQEAMKDLQALTLNGLSLNAIPDYSADRTAPEISKLRILDAASRLLRRTLPVDTRLLLISGRYEFHNKGIDLFLDSLAELNRSRTPEQPPLLALCCVMGGHNGVNPAAASGDPNQKPPVGPNWIDGEHGEPLPLHFSVLNGRLEVFVSEEDWRYDD